MCGRTIMFQKDNTVSHDLINEFKNIARNRRMSDGPPSSASGTPTLTPKQVLTATRSSKVTHCQVELDAWGSDFDTDEETDQQMGCLLEDYEPVEPTEETYNQPYEETLRRQMIPPKPIQQLAPKVISTVPLPSKHNVDSHKPPVGPKPVRTPKKLPPLPPSTAKPKSILQKPTAVSANVYRSLPDKPVNLEDDYEIPEVPPDLQQSPDSLKRKQDDPDDDQYEIIQGHKQEGPAIQTTRKLLDRSTSCTSSVDEAGYLNPDDISGPSGPVLLRQNNLSGTQTLPGRMNNSPMATATSSITTFPRLKPRGEGGSLPNTQLPQLFTKPSGSLAFHPTQAIPSCIRIRDPDGNLVKQRPLPATPVQQKVTRSLEHLNRLPPDLEKFPWYRHIERKEAEVLVKRGQRNGTYVIRDSVHGGKNSPYTLTLYYEGKVFNISIRMRPDGKFALGKEKEEEQTFHSIEEMVKRHRYEPLKLTGRDGIDAGKTVLAHSIHN